MDEKEQNLENTRLKQVKDEKGRWLPGVSGNPAGRPKGSKNFTTQFEKAVKEVAKKLELGEDPDAVEIQIIQRGIKEALAGKYPFYKDLFDRIYGQPTKAIDLSANLKVQKIQELEEKLKGLLEKE